MPPKKIRKRDEKAFLNAYDFFAPRLFRHVYFRVGSKEIAEDITSQIFLKTWKYLLSSSVENIQGFLYRVAHNALVDHYRAKERSPLPINEEFEKTVFYEKDIIKDILDQEELRAARRAIHRLKKDFRDVVVMRYIDGLSIEEIAAITQKSRNAVSIILSRAIKELKDQPYGRTKTHYIS